MIDYKAAYEQEKKTREEVESLLALRSKSLSIANDQLDKQFSSLKTESAQKAFLLHVVRYSQERLSLKDLLPELLGTMLELADLPLAVFDYLPIRRDAKSFRSELYINHYHPRTKGISEILKPEFVDDILASTSIDVLQEKEAIWVENLSELSTPDVNTIFKRFGINYLLAMPIVANLHVSAILFFFFGKLENDKQHIIDFFEAALNNLGFLIEHRYQDEQLRSNYARLSVTYKELKLAQTQLIQSEKLVSIGQLSAGIAHEVNNPTAFIKSNIGILKKYIKTYQEYFDHCQSLFTHLKKSTNEQLKDRLFIINQHAKENDLAFIIEDSACIVEESGVGVERIIDIVSGLKKFSRSSDNKKFLCQINSCVEEALKLSHNELKYNVTVEKNLAELPEVMANEGELVQVFVNLLINASRAISKRGKITVRTSVVRKDISVTVSDTGCGIDEKNLEHIFDPFFTTKPVGEGTGLGLSISYGIIENHGGRITVKSQLGKGTQFTIMLPTMIAIDNKLDT